MRPEWTIVVEYRGQRWEAFDLNSAARPSSWTDQDLETVPAPIAGALTGLVTALEADPYFLAAGS